MPRGYSTTRVLLFPGLPILIALLLLTTVRNVRAQPQIVPMLRSTEQNFTAVVVRGSDTLIAGDRSTLGVLRDGQLMLMNPPGPLVDIVDGIALNDKAFFLDAAGAVLIVEGDRITRMTPSAPALGMGLYRDSLALVCADRLLLCDTRGIVIRSEVWPDSIQFRSGSTIDNVIVGVTRDSLVVRVREGDVKVIDSTRSDYEQYTRSSSLLFVTGEWGAVTYSLAHDRSVNLDLQGSKLEELLRMGGARYIAKSSTASDIVLLAINRPIGNGLRSPVYLCRVSDTTLTVDVTIQSAMLANAESIAALHITGQSFIGVGPSSMIMLYEDGGTRYPLGYRNTQVVQTAKGPAGEACLLHLYDKDSVKGLFRFRSSFDRPWMESQLFHATSGSQPSCSLAVGEQYAYVSIDNVMYRATPEIASIVPTGTATGIHDLTASGNFLVYTSALAARSFISSDEGRTWDTVRGGKLTVGGDGRLYSVIAGVEVHSIAQDNPNDSTVTKLPNDAILSRLLRSTSGIVAVIVPLATSANEVSLIRLSVGRQIADVTYRLPVSNRWDLVSLALVGDSGAVIADESFDYFCHLFADGTQSTPIATSMANHLAYPPALVWLGLSSDSTYLEAFSNTADAIRVPLRGTTSVDEESLLQWVALTACYPNPTSDNMTVQIRALPHADFTTWRIGVYSLDGSIVKDLKPHALQWSSADTAQDIHVSLNHIPQGVYLVVSSNRGYVECQHIAIVR